MALITSADGETLLVFLENYHKIMHYPLKIHETVLNITYLLLKII